jgi:hypothetical protein
MVSAGSGCGATAGAEAVGRSASKRYYPTSAFQNSKNFVVVLCRMKAFLLGDQTFQRKKALKRTFFKVSQECGLGPDTREGQEMGA